MADVESNINVNIDTSHALESLKILQRQISAFHTQMAKSGAQASAVSANQAQNLMNSINAAGKFQASMKSVKTSTESFTDSLEKNKLTTREYFRYTGAATKTFGRLFQSEWDTINKVARERVKDIQTQYIKMGRGANGAMQAIAVRPLTLDMKSLGTQTAMAAQKQQLLNQLLKQGSTNMLNFGKNTQWAGRQLMVGFTVPLVMLGSQAAKTFMAMEEQAIRFKRVYGEMFTTQEETDQMVKQIQLLAKEYTKYGVAVEETMKMAADAAAMGKMGTDLTAQVAQATRLAVLGGVEQAQALETTISVTNAFGVATEDLTKKIDFLNAVENQTVVSIEDLTIAIPKAGPVVQQLGGDVEDLAFFLTAMKEGGINASEGANALKSGLASLINPSEKASKMLGGLGINIKGIVEANKGDIKSTVIGFAQALDTLDPLNRARAIEQLFGKFQFSRLSTLFQNVTAQGTQASRVLELTKATTEELAILSERELNRIEDTTTYKFKKSIEDLKVTLAPVGEQFLKALTPIVEFVSKILDKFNNLGDGSKKFLTIFAVAVGGIGPVLLMTFGLIANAVANIIKLFANMKSMYNRAGSSSKNLGDQTSYLTQEQLEASAVAASLDQVHQKLKQTFTSEASALSSLATAYQRAIAAQRAFGMPGPARGPSRPVPKFAEGGIISGPGGPKSDSIPVMASNGEAILSAEIVKKYPGLVQGLIAGKIPGFKNSGIATKPGASVDFKGQSFISTQATAPKITALISEAQKLSGVVDNIDDVIFQALTRVAKTGKITLGKFNSEMKALTDGAVAFRGGKLSGMASRTGDIQGGYSGNAGIVAAHGSAPVPLTADQAKSIGEQILARVPGNATGTAMLDAKSAGLRSNLTFPMPASFNKGEMTGSEGAQFVGQNRSRFTSMIAEQHGMDPNDPGLLDFGKRVGMALKKVGKTAVDDSKFYEIIKAEVAASLDESASESTRNAGAKLKKSANSYGTAQIITPTGRAKGDRMNMPKAAAGISIPGYEDKSLAGESYRSQDISKDNKSADKFIIKAVKKRVRRIFLGLESGIKEELQIASPSKKMKKVGKDAGAGLVQGAREYVDDARTVGQQIGAASTQAMAAANKTALYGSGPVDSGSKSLRRQLEKQERAKARTQAKAAASRTALYGTGPIDAEAKSVRRQLEKQQKMSSIGQNVAYPASVISSQTAQSSRRQMVSSRMRSVGGNIKGRVAGRMGGRMGGGGAMMAASGVAMAGSMLPGKVGEGFQKLTGPLMALTMIAPLLQSKFGALVVGVGAVVAAYAYMRMQFDKAQDAAFDLTTSMGVGKDAMVEMSKAAGKVSAGEVMDKRRSSKFNIIPIQTGKSTFGQSFVKQDIGKEMLSNIAKNGGTSASVDSTSAQLQNAVMSGAMSIDQAKSVAQNLGAELGDQSFGINVIAKMTSILGADGEDLEKNPLEVRIKMIEETRQRLNYATEATDKAADWNKGRKENLLGTSDAVQTAGGIAAGAGAGAGIGAAAGAMIGGPIGAAVGAVAGTVIGAVAGGIMGKINRAKRIGAMTGASVAQDKMALEQGQEMLDSFDLQYQRKIELLRTQGKINEAVELENKYYADRDKLLAANKKTKDIILSNFSGSDSDVQKAYMSGADKAVTKKYKDTVFEDMVPLAQSGIDDSSLTDEQKLAYKVEMYSGNIDPNQMINIFKAFDSKEDQELVLDVIGKFGGKFAGEMANVVNAFGDDKKAKNDYLIQVKAKSGKDAQEFQDFFGRLTTYGEVIPTSISVAYFTKNPEAQAALEGTIEKINANKGKMSIDFAAKTIGGDALAALTKDAAYFDALGEPDQKVYATALATQLSLQGDPEQQKAFKAWQAANPGSSPGDYLGFATANAQQITKANQDNTLPIVPGSESEGTKKQVESSPLDELVKRLRDVRMNQIKVTEGWGASQKALNKLFAGDKTIKVFSGIENDLRKIGAGEDFIEMIVGMDPKLYESKKNSLFRFDNKKNIIGLKEDAKNIQDAIQSISLGAFVSTQEKVVKEINNQNVALKRLRAAGVEGSVALEAVADATFAASIANKKLDDKEIKKIVTAWNKATKAKKAYAANDALISEEAELENRAKLLQKLVADSTKFTMDELEAIMQSPALQNALITPGVDQEQFKKTLQDALNKADVELKINKMTITGMEEIFDKGFNNAMEEIDVKEKALDLKFNVDTRAFNAAIQDAEDKIALAQYKIDDKEALLKEIADREQEINEKYDERVKALDEVEKANAAISQQQKSQLTLADALTSGDISAAAKAVQDMRAQEAANAAAKQRELLDKSREAELSRVKTKSGQTRQELEKEIKDLQDEIFKLEEEKIEPAREAIRQLDMALREAKKPLDDTRDMWDAIRNKIDLAKVATAEFQAAITSALNVANGLKAAYEVKAAPTPAPTPAATAAIVGATVPVDPKPEITPTQEAADAAAALEDALNAEFDATAAELAALAAAELAEWNVSLLTEQTDALLAELDAMAEIYGPKADAIAAEIAKTKTETPPKTKTETPPKTKTETPPVKTPVVKKTADEARSEAAAAEAIRAANAKSIADKAAAEKLLAEAEARKNGTLVPYKPLSEFEQAELDRKVAAAKKTLNPPKPPVINLFDKDGDGVENLKDKFPNDASRFAMGGIVPKYFALGGFAKGTDTVPAMLTPGEFIMSKYAVDSYGVDNMRKINKGDALGGSVYNNTYTLTVNAKTNANPNEIAQAVMSTIKQVDDRRIRGVNINGR